MNSIQIDQILKRDKNTKKIYIGVFSRDELPKNLVYPCLFILNTAKRSSSGEHWLAFYFSKEKICTFFDSYGNHPKFFRLYQYIKNGSKKFLYNKKTIQGPLSEYCGYYCILFSILTANGYSLKRFNKLFSNSSIKNDNLIEKLIKTI